MSLRDRRFSPGLGGQPTGSAGAGHGVFGHPDGSGGSVPIRGKQGHWTLAQTNPLSWGAPNTTYNAATAIQGTHFRTPVFDLRYGLGEVDGYAQRQQKNIEPNVMLGVEFGLWLGLEITFSGTAVDQYPAFRFYCIEFGNEMNPTPQAVHFLQSRRDVTTSVYAGYNPTTTSLQTSLYWVPYGPFRYWGVALCADQISATDANGVAIAGLPSILITGALH